ncbi:MAG: TonB-dependent siderophore receptor [Comamonadaceae bacterium]|nr:MAG: TonB-dependent siderophore receptor [Comamonadaceae bacterium]
MLQSSLSTSSAACAFAPAHSLPVPHTSVQFCIALLLAGGSLAAQAQAAADAQPASASLSTVTIQADALDPDDARPRNGVSTATKTALPLKDIPQTVDVLEVSKFKTYGINDLSVLLDGTPGIDTTYDTRGDGISIRGFDASSGDIYRDGVRATGQIRRSTANVERVEILKGPASVLYGRATGGGIVNLVSRQASFDAVSSVSLRGGSWGNRGGMLDINRVISPFAAVRLTVDREEADSFRRGISNHNTMVSPSLLLDNQRGLRWLLQYTHDTVWRQPDRAPAYDSLPADASFRTAYSHPDDFIEDKMQMLRSVLSYDFNDAWSIKWTGARHKASQDFDHLYGGSYCQPNGRLLSNNRACATPGGLTFTRAWQETANTTLTNMLDLSGRFSTGAIRHDLLLGLEKSDDERTPYLATSLTDRSLTYAQAVNPYYPVWLSPKTPRGAATTANQHEASASAFYFQDMLSLGEQWKVLLGGRYDRFDFHSTNLLTGQNRGYKGNSFSPRAGVVWQPVPAHSLYASYSKSFSPYGGRGLLSVSVADNAVYDAEPQYSRQFEIGTKSDWLDGRLSTQVALYNLELYNIRYQPDPENDPYTWAVRGSERSRGIEFSATGRIAAGWYLRSGLGLQQAKVTEDKSVPANEGKYKSGVARKNGHIFVRYAPESRWYGELGVTYRGPFYTSIANTTERAGYTRWDASVGWRAAPWTMTFAITNLTDKRYWRSTSMPGAPRTFLLTGSYMF